jgi:HSP20 family protein
MRELTLWKQQEIDKLGKDTDQLFMRFRKEFGIPHALTEVAESFAMDLSETENTLTVKAELPDIKPGDIEVSVTEDTPTLKGKTDADTAGTGEGYRRVDAGPVDGDHHAFRGEIPRTLRTTGI